MTHLLDTNSCVDHLRRGQASNVTAKLAAAPSGSVVLCSVVAAGTANVIVHGPNGATVNSHGLQPLAPLRRFFAASRTRLREVATHLVVHHLARFAGSPGR